MTLVMWNTQVQSQLANICTDTFIYLFITPYQSMLGYLCLTIIVFNHIFIHSYIHGSLNKFPEIFRMGTFIDSTHMKL